ncbi:MAG: NAD(P)-dependent oxidoreductase [Spirochaetota bacterium]
MGIIGLGAIGSRVAQIASSFGCEVVYYSTSGKNDNALCRRVDLDELLSTSRVVSIHAPLNDRTENIINAGRLEKMRKDAILINVGRGGIVNEQDLAYALDRETIAGAGLDVLAKEPISADNPLLGIKNSDRLFISPHIAWTGAGARKTLLEMTLANIESFIQSSRQTGQN